MAVNKSAVKFDKKYNWTVFVSQADEWLVEYSLPPNLPQVKLSLVGHAVELYLKAVVTKQTGDIGVAIQQGHSIKKLWDLCKKDPTFMPEYEIRSSVFDLDLVAPEGIILYGKLSEADYKHYQENAELYAIAKVLPHLKYGYTPSSQFPDSYRVPGWLWPNPYWTRFVKGMRSYLGPLPTLYSGEIDYIKDRIGLENLPEGSRSYLSGLYE